MTPSFSPTYTVTAKFLSWTATSAPVVVTVIGGPTVTGVSSPSADGTYGVGASIPVEVSFSEPVIVTGTPQLILSTISPATTAVNYTGGVTNTLTFTYTVAAGNNTADLNYDSEAALVLNGGTITNALGTNAILTLPAPAGAGSLGANKNIVIDGVAPVVTNVTSTTANATYGPTAVIPVTVAFNDAVTVTGNPQLALDSGGTATYASGSDTSTLTFNYTVAAGQTSADLDYTAVSSLTLNGGTIKDAATNNATLTLPTPGGPGSLGANQNIVIDAAAPTVSTLDMFDTNGNGKVDQVKATFSETLATYTAGNTSWTLTNVPSGGTLSSVSVSGAVATLTISEGTNPADTAVGSFKVALIANANGIRDAAGNQSAFAATAPIDKAAPVVLTITEASTVGNKEIISGTTTENTGTLTVVVYPGSTATGTPLPKTYTITTFTGTPLAWSVTTSPNDLTAGTTYTAQATHVDGATNTSNQPTKTFLGN